MDIHIGWLELAIICGAFVAMAWLNSRCQQSGGMDMVPGNGIGQAPDMEQEEGRLGFRS